MGLLEKRKQEPFYEVREKPVHQEKWPEGVGCIKGTVFEIDGPCGCPTCGPGSEYICVPYQETERERTMAQQEIRAAKVFGTVVGCAGVILLGWLVFHEIEKILHAVTR